MDLHYRREATVGLLVVAAIVVFVIGTGWLEGKAFGSGREFAVTVPDATGLKLGSAVSVQGVPAGRVTGIELAPPDQVRLRFRLNDGIVPKEDASAGVIEVSLVGEYAVALRLGTSTIPLPEGREIRPYVVSGLREAALTLKDKADTLLDGANAIVNRRTADELYATAKQLRRTLEATERVMRTYGDVSNGPVAELTATMQQFRALSARLDTALADPVVGRLTQRADTLTGNLGEMTRQLTATGTRLDSLLAGVQRGEGTLGRFAKDSAFHDQTVKLMQSMDSLLQDLRKHPGKIGVTVKLF